MATATNEALGQVELEPGTGSPTLGELVGIPGRRTWRVGKFSLPWCCIVRGDTAGVAD